MTCDDNLQEITRHADEMQRGVEECMAQPHSHRLVHTNSDSAQEIAVSLQTAAGMMANEAGPQSAALGAPLQHVSSTMSHPMTRQAGLQYTAPHSNQPRSAHQAGPLSSPTYPIRSSTHEPTGSMQMPSRAHRAQAGNQPPALRLEGQATCGTKPHFATPTSNPYRLVVSGSRLQMETNHAAPPQATPSPHPSHGGAVSRSVSEDGATPMTAAAAASGAAKFARHLPRHDLARQADSHTQRTPAADNTQHPHAGDHPQLQLEGVPTSPRQQSRPVSQPAPLSGKTHPPLTHVDLKRRLTAETLACDQLLQKSNARIAANHALLAESKAKYDDAASEADRLDSAHLGEPKHPAAGQLPQDPAHMALGPTALPNNAPGMDALDGVVSMIDLTADSPPSMSGNASPSGKFDHSPQAIHSLGGVPPEQQRPAGLQGSGNQPMQMSIHGGNLLQQLSRLPDLGPCTSLAWSGPSGTGPEAAAEAADGVGSLSLASAAEVATCVGQVSNRPEKAPDCFRYGF